MKSGFMVRMKLALSRGAIFCKYIIFILLHIRVFFYTYAKLHDLVNLVIMKI